MGAVSRQKRVIGTQKVVFLVLRVLSVYKLYNKAPFVAISVALKNIGVLSNKLTVGAVGSYSCSVVLGKPISATRPYGDMPCSLLS